ncbi:MAG: GTPase ObgE [Clostridia bacterium]|nr:GTPase ObgE [Clostridia bacterium]
MPLFVDQVTITAKAGNGGNGAVSFHREKFVQNGGPDGGDGGRGGDVVLLAESNMHTLLDFRYRGKYEAEAGQAGSSRLCNGKSGAPLIIKVPVGTVVRDAATGRLCADMFEHGQRKVLMHGGRGGWGNSHFANAVRQAPNFAKPGQKCEPREFVLELKSIADVGLVGYPNVGKSTILSVATSARPKIANYHFTTLTPNLGIVRQDETDFIMADIPGLVEGAHAGVGLGHAFLRHVERTRLLVHVLDISGSEGRDPLQDFDRINDELARYGSLADRPQIVAANKMDLLPDAEANLARLRALLGDTDIDVYPVSAVTRKGFKELLRGVAAKLAELPPSEAFPEEEEALLAEEQAPFTVSRRDSGNFVVEGSSMERLMDSVNFGDVDSLNWFHRTLRRTGVIDALREAGAQEGDTVEIIDMEFDFVE